MTAEPTDEELADRYRPRIEAELADLDAATEATTGDRKPVELDQQSVGRLSRMDAMQGQAMAAAVESRRAQRRSALEASLRRMAEGEFGWCARCGEFIGEGRLDVDPAAATCVICAGRPG
ncbi:RNA polymerase-binding transcription factor DksA [Defluviimonas aquaemixtae]|uniref:RNA polymerase-binding transcription factor DksA n=1 Tax=Albidovulum aquaemixtae TaxID=1542388 RepID=A0A2R8B6W3_9RHOB|nr:TraR/DksA C4-type zinc finger protein [Defluviimonas aquaemixtae]SPH18385.1 RNA polymerase-binding transcription factor DksA [Defluviimonas aquaemixtae]